MDRELPVVVTAFVFSACKYIYKQDIYRPIHEQSYFLVINNSFHTDIFHLEDDVRIDSHCEDVNREYEEKSV